MTGVATRAVRSSLVTKITDLSIEVERISLSTRLYLNTNVTLELFPERDTPQ